eukprot:15466581-Alexandrium_andersonii.AAC.1
MGVTANLTGSFLYECMVEGPRSHKNNLSDVWCRVQQIYAEQNTKHRVKRVTKDMFSGSFAVLTRLKAAELACL